MRGLGGMGSSWEALEDELGGFPLDSRLEPTALSNAAELMERLGSPERRGQAKARGRPKTSVAAKDVKEARHLQKEVLALTKRAETAESKNDEFREKMKAMRGALSTREKQLALAKRSVERLGSERDQLEVVRAQEKAHSRKLEIQVNSRMGLNELTAQWKSMKKQVKTMEETVRTAENKLLSAEEVQRAQKSEIRTLRRALDINAHELSAMGGHDINSRLLYAVAHGREEGVSLAVQLAEQRDAATSYKMDLSKAQLEIRRLEDKLRELQQDKESLEASALQLRAECKNHKASSESASERLGAAELRYQRLEDDNERLHEELRRERSRAEKLADEGQELQRNGKRSVEAARRDMVAALEDVTQAATRQQQQLKQRVQELREEHTRAEMLWVDERRELQRRAGQAETARDIAQSKAAEHEGALANVRKELQAEISNLHSDCDALTDANHKLQSSQRALQKELAEREERLRNLEAELHEARAELHEARQAVDASAQAKYNQLLHEMCNVSDERDQLAGEIRQALTDRDASISAQGVLQREVARLTEMNQSLSHSKAGMQRSMMEEVARVQAALNEAKRENAQLRQLAHPLPTVGSTDRFQQAFAELGAPWPREEGHPGRSSAVAAYTEAMHGSCGPADLAQLASRPGSECGDARGAAGASAYAHSKSTYALNASSDSLGLQSPGDSAIMDAGSAFGGGGYELIE